MTKKSIVNKKKLISGGNTRSVRSREARKKLQEIHDQRSERAQDIDASLYAPIAPNVGAWVEDPNRYDAPGVDTPVEWRSKREIKSVKAYEEAVGKMPPELVKTPRTVAYATADRYERLKWQEKHPFITAQKYHVPGGENDGIKQYEWAMRSGSDFGFDLKNPQRGFLDSYNLKRYDIKGMRVNFVDSGDMKLSGAAAFYIPEPDAIFVAPIDPPTTENKAIQANYIRHEVGHHIMHTSLQLDLDWKRRDIHMIELRSPSKSPYASWRVVKINKLVSMAEIAENNKKYFPIEPLPIKPAKLWREHYKAGYGSRSLSKSQADEMIAGEMWAEMFKIYRNGDLKRTIKYQRARLEDRGKDLDWWSGEYDRVKNQLMEIPKAERPINLIKEVEGNKTHIRMLENDIRAYSVALDNLVRVERWMKEHDDKMWGIGTYPTLGEEKPTVESFKPNKISDVNLMMMKADGEIFKKPKTPELPEGVRYLGKSGDYHYYQVPDTGHIYRGLGMTSSDYRFESTHLAPYLKAVLEREEE